jgi:hypothetical protein
MAIVKKYSASVPVQLEPAWRARLQAVADHPAVEVSLAAIVRHCIEAALPQLELEVGILNVEELDDEQLAALGVVRVEEKGPEPDNRAVGCFGGPPKQG